MKYPTLYVRSHVNEGQDNISEQELEGIFYLLQEQGLLEIIFYDGMIQDASDFVTLMQADDVAFYAVGTTQKEWEQYQKQSVNACTKLKEYKQYDEQFEAKKTFAQAEQGPHRASFFSDNVFSTPKSSSFVPLAFWWLNSFLGSGAMIHFTFFAKGVPVAPYIGKFVTRAMLLAINNKPAPYEVCVGSKQKVQEYIAAQGEEKFCLDALYGLTPKVYRHALQYVQNLGFTIIGALPYSLRMAKRKSHKPSIGVVSFLTRDAWL